MSPKAQLIITLEQTGKISISGPINDKILAYGLLEAARDAIKEFGDQQSKMIQTAPASALSLVGAH